jgi:hypothetical protein
MAPGRRAAVEPAYETASRGESDGLVDALRRGIADWRRIASAEPAHWHFCEFVRYGVASALAQARYLPGVPDWMAGWEFLYLLTATLASLATKLLLRLD